MKFKSFLDKYFCAASRVCIISAILAALILMISVLSDAFSDFFNRYISSLFRFIVSKITGILPFSLGEALVLCLPLFVIVALFLYFKVYSKDDIKAGRFVVAMFSCICLMFTSFVMMFGVAYHGRSLDRKLNLEIKPLTYNELEATANIMMDEIEAVIDELDYRYDGASRMPYSFDELNEKLNDAYVKFCDKYSYVQKMKSNVKVISLSPIMTYTHISGVFTYYTAEANVNVNYPDYTMPYTMAHEMAHQRGVAPENEANFTAFLVCMESDDPYIRYSGALSLLEYMMDAMSIASPEEYAVYASKLDMRVRGEMIAFSRFFEPYRESVASEVTNAINDTYLKATGDKAGARSYGMVVDLACAYYGK